MPLRNLTPPKWVRAHTEPKVPVSALLKLTEEWGGLIYADPQGPDFCHYTKEAFEVCITDVERLVSEYTHV